MTLSFERTFAASLAPGQTFSRSTPATIAGSADEAPADAPRFGLQGLLLEPAASAIYDAGRYFEGMSTFTALVNADIAPSPLMGPFGRRDFYAKVTSTAAGGYRQRNTTVPDDDNAIMSSVYVAKGGDQVARIRVGLAGGSVWTAPQSVDFNLHTGAITTSTGEVWIDDEGDNWRVSVLIENNASGHTLHYLLAVPDVSATGSFHVGGVNVVPGATTPSSYIPGFDAGGRLETAFTSLSGWAAISPYVPAPDDLPHGSIENNRYVCVPGRTEYQWRQLDFTASRLFAKARWTSTGDGGADTTALALISSYESALLQNMFHFVITREAFYLQKRAAGGAFINVLGHTFSAPLALDTDYDIGTWVEGTNAYVSVGNEVWSAADNDLQTLIGTYVVVEHYAGGPVVADRLEVTSFEAEGDRTALPSPVTRAADSLGDIALSSSLDEATLVAGFTFPYGLPAGASAPAFVSLRDALNANYGAVRINQTNQSHDFAVAAGGALSALISVPPYFAIDSQRSVVAGRIKADDFAYTADGTTVYSDTQGSGPTGMDRLRFIQPGVPVYIDYVGVFDGGSADAALQEAVIRPLHSVAPAVFDAGAPVIALAATSPGPSAPPSTLLGPADAQVSMAGTSFLAKPVSDKRSTRPAARKGAAKPQI
ncbi:MAG: hypothetical protein AAF221_14050 [Pseudomonadota bacterium]